MSAWLAIVLILLGTGLGMLLGYDFGRCIERSLKPRGHVIDLTRRRR